MKSSCWIVVVCAFAMPSALASQSARILYNHEPGTGSIEGRLSYIRSGDLLSEVRPGRPAVLLVPKGSQVCIEIQNGNRLLYGYGMAATSAPVDSVPGLSEIIKRITSTVARAPLAEESGLPAYITALALLYDSLTTLEALIHQSDAEPDFREFARTFQTRFEGAAAVKRVADGISGRLRPPNDTAQGVLLLKALHVDLWKRATALNDRIRTAAATTTDPVCAIVNDRVQLSLSVSRVVAVPANGRAARPVGDNLVTVIAEPTDTRRVMVSSGILMTMFVQDRTEFFERNGLVQSRRDHTPTFGAFAVVNYRLLMSSQWVSVGATASESGLTGGFFGWSSSLGHSLTGPGLVFGAGLSVTSVPTELKEGAVNSAVPAGKKLADIVRRELRPGFGVFVSFRL